MKANNELGLHIDTSKMYHDLVWEFVKTIDKVADELLMQMKSRTRTAVVQSSLKKKVMFDTFNDIEILVGSDHWQSFLDNYGVGSLMASESENPYLSEYKSSELWHGFRNSTAISARPKGTYIVPDWEKGDGYVTRESSGRFPAGTNLERMTWGNNDNLTVTPQRPTFFMEHSFEFMKPIFVQRLMEVYENFPFHKYIRGGK